MDDWAPRRFQLPKSSAISGLINLDWTPYNKEILAQLSPQSPTRKVVLICGTQIAKSTIILMSFAYRVDCGIYGDMLYYFPTDEMGRHWSKTKLADTIRANDYLINSIEKGPKKEDNVTFKKWESGALVISGGKAGSKYRMHTGNFIVADDFAEFPMNVGKTKDKVGEGSADKLLEDRGSGTMESAKIFINSSPKSEADCPAWRAYKLTDQQHFFITCPKCGKRQAWEFENVIMPHEDYKITEEPWIACQNQECEHRIYEADKMRVMQGGKWQPTVESADKLVHGYRMPSVYSLLGYPLSKMCQDWLDACKIFDETGDDSEKIRHRNSKQARPWKKKAAKTVKHSELYQTRVSLDPLPEDCAILNMGVDVQDESLEAQVNGRGENNTYFIDHIKFTGDPRIKFGQEGSPWNDLQNFILTKRYKNVNNIMQPICNIAIDLRGRADETAGFAGDFTKDFIKRAQLHYFQKIFGVFGKGSTKATIAFITTSTKDVDGFESWGLYVNNQKKAIYNQFTTHLHGRGNLFFSDRPCFSEKWFRQLTIERPDERGVFQKPHDHARNEALDCYIYSHAAFVLAFKDYDEINWQSYKDWNKKEIETAQQTREAKIVGSAF